jgi:hypothetical protein
MSYGYNAFHNGNDDNYSPFAYQHNSPFFIPAYNSNRNTAPTRDDANYSHDRYAATQHEYGSDGAYCPNSGDNNHLGNNHLGNNYRDSPPSPESHREYDEALTRRAAEYGLTPRELQEANEECIREQNEWLVTTYGADRRDHEGEGREWNRKS